MSFRLSGGCRRVPLPTSARRDADDPRSPRRRFGGALLVALATLLAAGAAEAQQIEAGVKIGRSSSSITGFDEAAREAGAIPIPGVTAETTGRTGFAIGGFLRAGRDMGAVVVSLQPELLYVRKGDGWRVTGSVPGFGTLTAEGLLHLDYLEVPVLAHVEFAAGPVRPYLFFGPAASFELSCSVIARAPGVNETESCEEAEIEDRPAVDLGAVGGGGLGVPVPGGHGRFLLEARYNAGLRDLRVLREEFAGREARNRVFLLSAGFAVPLR